MLAISNFDRTRLKPPPPKVYNALLHFCAWLVLSIAWTRQTEDDACICCGAAVSTGCPHQLPQVCHWDMTRCTRVCCWVHVTLRLQLFGGMSFLRFKVCLDFAGIKFCYGYMHIDTG